MKPVAIRLNGETRELPSGATIADLLHSLGLDPRAVAIERNGAILPRAEYPVAALADGDRVEIVRFVQGGEERTAQPLII